MGVYPNKGMRRRLGLRTKRHLNGAVVRNRLKRQLRAIYRQQRRQLVEGYDLLVVIHPPSLPASSTQLQREFVSLCRRLDILCSQDLS